jgi:hypothetical protein
MIDPADDLESDALSSIDVYGLGDRREQPLDERKRRPDFELTLFFVVIIRLSRPFVFPI